MSRTRTNDDFVGVVECKHAESCAIETLKQLTGKWLPELAASIRFDKRSRCERQLSFGTCCGWYLRLLVPLKRESLLEII